MCQALPRPEQKDGACPQRALQSEGVGALLGRLEALLLPLPLL